MLICDIFIIGMIFYKNLPHHFFKERNDKMNIPELSTALANTQVMNLVGLAVLDKALENSQAAGEGLIQMMDRSMELSVNPYIGGNIDLFV